jgi:hypothetical protein
MGIERHFDLWNHFFRARLLQGSGMETTALGGVDLRVKPRHGVDPYLHFPTSESIDGVTESMVLFEE